MRCLTRNKSTFHYALYESQTEIVDEYGNYTGQYSITYGKPQRLSGNVSAAQGEIQSRQFGDSVTYDKVIVLDNPDIPIDEYSILWVDTEPHLSTDGRLRTSPTGVIETPHNYIVKGVARSLNSVSIAISKVSVG